MYFLKDNNLTNHQKLSSVDLNIVTQQAFRFNPLSLSSANLLLVTRTVATATEPAPFSFIPVPPPLPYLPLCNFSPPSPSLAA